MGRVEGELEGVAGEPHLGRFGADLVAGLEQCGTFEQAGFGWVDF